MTWRSNGPFQRFLIVAEWVKGALTWLGREVRRDEGKGKTGGRREGKGERLSVEE